jgi:hypothetical protein
LDLLNKLISRSRGGSIEEIQCSVKPREKTGEIVYKLGGDETVMKEWEEATKKRGVR